MKLPSKTQLTIAAVLVVVGAFIVFNYSSYSRSGWYLIIFALTFFIFPCPQLYSRTKRSRQQQQQMRERVIEASNKPLGWWSSPIPWLLALLLVVVFSMFTAKAAETKFITVGEFELEYEMAGSGKHTILLEAGGSSAMTDWEPVFTQIAEKAKVIRYSRVGNGNSTQIKRHFTSLDYADYVSELLAKLEITEPVILVAHSYGGSVARDFAAAYPDRIKALLMLDPSSEHDVDVVRAINLEQGNREIAQIKLDDMKEGMSNQYLDFWSKRPLPDYPQIKNMPVTVIVSIKKMANPPYLFFTDQGRELWGEHWQNWTSDFPQGRTVLTDKSGHFIQFDEPDLVLAELNRLIGLLNAPEKSMCIYQDVVN